MPQSFAEELSSIPMSTHLGQSLERAHRFAREQSHRAVTLEHLLLALTEDAEAAVILQSANIELGRLSTEVSGYLGRLPEDMRGDGVTEPRPDAELLRVLQAAASAAKQSRRRQIDGAIVLAAVVGDGKTAAAGLLKALGMTFEEAIRALQRANTKARLKPTSKPATPARADTKPAASAEPAETAAVTEPASSDAAPGPLQSAEDILAAARSRIQQRSGVGPAKPAAVMEAPPARAPDASQEPGADAADSQPPVEPAETAALTDAIKAAMSASTVRGVEPASPKAAADPPAPPLQPPAPPVAQAPPWTPPPPARPQPQNRVPQTPPARPQPPFPARPVAASEGPRRPPLPPPGQPQVGFPNRPPRGAPWPEPGVGGRPPLANGSYAEAPPAPRERPVARGPQAPWSPQAPRAGGHAEKGLLVEAVPRRMRVGVPATAEVRIARDRIEGLIAVLNGRGAAPLAEQPLTRALSVRLRAPGGDFWIEPATPETQWVESANSMIHDNHAIWRWTVVARRRGRGRLALMVSARTVGRDGLAVESAPPDRIIEVKVGANYRRAAVRWAGWILALLVGTAIGSYWEQLRAIAVPVIKQALGD
jgi:hypothetical protein